VVTIAPAAPFTITTPDMYGAFSGGGAEFGGNYRHWYRTMPMPGMYMNYPTGTETFKSITGIAIPAFGGAVNPRQMSDFAL
jgi:hypothetical protein